MGANLDVEQHVVIFYAASALVALFCLIALGLGPPVFAIAGVALAVWSFRRRRHSWWALAASAAGLAEAIGALAAIRGRSVVLATVATFAAFLALRLVAFRWLRRDQDRPGAARPVDRQAGL